MIARLTGETTRYLGVGAAIGAFASLLPADVSSGLAVLGALVLPVVVWLAATAPRDEVRILLPIFLAAVAVRATVAIAIAYTAPDYFALDHERYQRVGWALAEYWAGSGAGPEFLTDKAGYYVWNALIYTVVGYAPLAVTLSNAAVAGLTVVLTYRMARDLAGAAAARMAALFAAFFPSLVLWSSLNLKDALAILTILVALRGAQLLQTSFSPVGIAMLAAGLAGLAQLRDYLVVLVVASAGIAILLPRLRGVWVPATLAAGVALCILGGQLPRPVEQTAEEASFEILDRSRRNLALGGSAYHGDADVSTPVAAMRFLPVGLAYFLLAPAPWQLWNGRQWMTLPEMLLWYALLPQVFFGLRHAARGRVAATLPLAIFVALATVSYALVESNLGTAYRHRAQVLVFYLIFAAVGIATRRADRGAAACLASRPTPAVAT